MSMETNTTESTLIEERTEETMLTSVTQSLITFLVVSFLCTTALLLAYLAKQGPPSRFRLPMSYHYSALSQSELDPEEEETEAEVRGHVALTADSSDSDDDVFYSANKPATIIVNNNNNNVFKAKKESSSSSLLQSDNEELADLNCVTIDNQTSKRASQ